MLKRILFACGFLFVPQSVFAAMITWEAYAEITLSQSFFNPTHFPQAPPVGTPWLVQFAFDPDAATHTPFAPASAPCSVTAATGTFYLGGAGYALTGHAFTNSVLPFDNCGPHYPLGAIEFFFFPTPLVADDWGLTGSAGYLKLLYFDSIHQDGTFPRTPTIGPPFNELLFHNDYFQFFGPFEPRALEQPTEVPEPGTMTLVGLGLALALRRRMRRWWV